jgi:putative DNA primase/helicase
MPLADNIRLDTSWTASKDRSTTNVAKIAAIIEHDVKFAKDPVGNLFYWEGGVFKRGGEQVISEMYKRWLVECQSLDDWRAGRAKDITEFISIDTPLLRERPPMEAINLLNGLYSWEKQKLFPHNPLWRSNIQIPITYDDSAECPIWDEFLSTVLPYSGGPNYLHEILGVCLIPFTSLQKSIVLVGEGSNGKSTFLNGLQNFIGHDNVCNIPLHILTSPTDRFSRAGIVGKLVNVFGDMSAKKIEDTQNFKAITGEDKILVEFKHKEAYYYQPFCKLIFSCNEVVKSDDESDGYKRRFIHIPFTQRFKPDPKIGKELAESLADPKELSGLFNKVVRTLPNVVENGLTLTPQIVGIIDDWCPIPDDTKAFLAGALMSDPESKLPMTAYYNWHVSNCPTTEAFSMLNLVKYIKSLFPGVISNRVCRIHGKPTRCFDGIRLRDTFAHNEVLMFVKRATAED